MNESPRAPALLSNSSFYGTLAATRAYGESGIPVWVADGDFFGVSRWSRHATRTLDSPGLCKPVRFVEWLIELGAREPGVVLYPTSDDAAFLYSLHRDALSTHYRMYQPSLPAMLSVLDKKRLYRIAQEVGLEVPTTWFPESERDVERIAADAKMPMLVKPRMQVLSPTQTKGVIVDDRASLATRWSSFVSKSHYDDVLLAHVPDASQAMLQQYLPEAAEQIYVLAAFLTRDGEHFAARSAMKVFQRPRSLGIGLCFENAPLSPELADAARRLAMACGYYGLFQLELIKHGDRYLLIDFNPRYYNQLAFDIARGLPLPSIVYAAAHGDEREVARLLSRANAETPPDDVVFCNAFGLEVMLSTQRLTGRLSAREASHWRSWRARHRGRSIDPTRGPGDELPGIVDICAQLYGYARHPRAFLRKLVLDKTT